MGSIWGPRGPPSVRLQVLIFRLLSGLLAFCCPVRGDGVQGAEAVAACISGSTALYVSVVIRIDASIACTVVSVMSTASAGLSASSAAGRTALPAWSEQNYGYVLRFDDGRGAPGGARCRRRSREDALSVAGAKAAHLKYAEAGDQVQLDGAAVLVDGGPLQLGLLPVPAQQELHHGLIRPDVHSGRGGLLIHRRQNRQTNRTIPGGRT